MITANRVKLASSLLLLGVLVLVAFLAVFHGLQGFRARGLSPDDWVFASVARVINDGGLPYRDAWDHKPPMIYLYLSPFLSLFGNEAESVKIAALMLTIIAVPLSAGLMWALSRSRVAAFAAGLLTAIFATIRLTMAGADTVTLMSAFTAAAMLAAAISRGRAAYLVLAGALFAAGFFSKQVNLFEFPALLLLAAWQFPKRRIISITAIAAGFAVLIVAFILIASQQGILEQAWYQAFETNFLYTAERSGIWHLRQEGIELFQRYFLTSALPFLAPLLLLALPLLLLWRSSKPRLVAFSLFWLLLATLGASIGRAWRIDYFFQVLTPLILLAALSIDAIYKQPTWVKIAASAIILIAGTDYAQRFGQSAWWDANLPERLPPVTDYVNAHSEQHDCVWYWGDASRVGLYTGRQSCSGFIYPAPMMVLEAFDTNRNRVDYLRNLYFEEPALHVRDDTWGYFPELQRYADRYLGELALETPDYQVFAVNMEKRTRHDVRFGDSIELIGSDTRGDEPYCAGQQFELAQTWSVRQPIDRYYQMFLHVVPENGSEIVSQYDGAPSSERPTDTWTVPGHIIFGDFAALTLPDLPGTYAVNTGFYDYETLERLSVSDASGNPIGNSYRLLTLQVEECE